MRNLKKILCLVLVFAMVCSMFVTANAQFKDDAEIDNLVAAEFLNGIGVLKGYEDGTFKPNGTLTRAEGATLIARLILGEAAEKLSATGAAFDDVKAADWFAGYVEYCVAEGIVAGYGNGKFGPNDTLTVAQFAKMLLTALGYEASREGFTGASWATPVLRLVNTLGLLDEAVTTMASNCSRQVAAQMALNTLKTTMVVYEDNDAVVEGEGIKVTIGGMKADPATEYDFAVAAGNNGHIENGDSNDVFIQFAERYWSKVELHDQVASDRVLGRPIGQVWTYKDIKVETEPDDELLKSYTGTVYVSTLADLVGDRVLESLEKGKMTLEVRTDGVGGTVAASAIHTYISDKIENAEKTLAGTGAGVLTEVYADEDTVTIAIINTYVAIAADDYNADTKELKVDIYNGVKDTSGTQYMDLALSLDDHDVEGYLEDDFLLVNIDKSKTSGAAQVIAIAPAKVVSGEIETFATSTVDYLRSITVDGKKYGYAATSQITVAGNPNALDASMQGTPVSLVLDAYGNVITFANSVEGNNYVYVAGIYTPNANITVTGKGTYTAALYFADGTYEEVEVGAYFVGNTKSATIPTGFNKGWHTFTVNADGKYVLATASRATGTLALADLKGNTTAIKEIADNGATTGYFGSNTTTYIVVDEAGDAKVYTGFKNMVNVDAQLKTGATGTAGLVIDVLQNRNNAFAKLVYVGPANDKTDVVARGAKSDNSTLLYVYREAYATSVDAQGVTYNTQNYVLVNGVKEAITVDPTVAAGGFLAKGLYTNVKFDMTTGYVVAAEEVARMAGMDDVIAADGTDEFVVISFTSDKDTEADDAAYVEGILRVNGKNYPMADDATVILAKDTAGNYATYSTVSMNRAVKEANAKDATVTFTGILDSDGVFVETLYVNIP